MNNAPIAQTHHQEPIPANMTDTLHLVKTRLGHSTDLVTRQMQVMHAWPAALLYIEGMVDTQMLHQSILESLMQEVRPLPEWEGDKSACLTYLRNEVLVAGDMETVDKLSDLLDFLLAGSVILQLDGLSTAIAISACGWEDRNVTEPQSQTVVRGPMEGFTENLRTNTTLVRRKIRSPELWLETMPIGRVTKTNVALMFIHGVAEDGIVEEVRRRLRAIEIDSVLESGYLEEFIQDTAKSPFPTLYNSERPDTIAAGLLEGRVAILVDGTPFVLLVPALFNHFFQSPEDYYQRADISTLIRMIRYLCFFIAMLAPSFYIAITTYHQEMLPTGLLINLAAQREGVPFPAFIEAVLMELTYEILREAGVRIPKTVGQAVSIVGTLVVGQAAVEAGVVSAAMVIIVSITAISSYVIPENGMSIAVRMLRFVLMGLAAAFGFYGILIGMLCILLHLTSLRSFGVSYMSPYAPFQPSDIKDTLFRLPWTHMRRRPLSAGGPGKQRLKKPPKRV
ncbi:spore germination protein [Paenibacillus daejeonensis]|uniref:spore germination protein n=1 Tax=Paenibacillus daejeonensis TaxID=135193 RepID=UPI00037D522F|nr:spore germination protein [Paenibacillus daejeonensis]